MSNKSIFAVVQAVIDGKHGKYAVATADGTKIQGSITFSLDSDVWKESSIPERGTLVFLQDLRFKKAGARAYKASFATTTQVADLEDSKKQIEQLAKWSKVMGKKSFVKRYPELFSKDTEAVWKDWLKTLLERDYPDNRALKEIAMDSSYLDGIRARAVYLLFAPSNYRIPFYWKEETTSSGGRHNTKALKEIAKVLPTNLVDYLVDTIIYFHQVTKHNRSDDEYGGYNHLLMVLIEALQEWPDNPALKRAFTNYDLECQESMAILFFLRNSDIHLKWHVKMSNRMQKKIRYEFDNGDYDCYYLMKYFESIRKAILNNRKYNKKLLVAQILFIMKSGKEIGWYPPNPFNYFSDLGELKFIFRAFEKEAPEFLEEFCEYVLSDKVVTGLYGIQSRGIDNLEFAYLIQGVLNENYKWKGALDKAIQEAEEKKKVSKKAEKERNKKATVAQAALKKG